MRKLGTAVVLTWLATWSAVSSGAAPDPPSSSPTDSPDPTGPSAKKQRPAAVEPPVPPRKYLETAARLYNKGRYDQAARYLKAAQMYRDRLSPNERIVLDAYREKLDLLAAGRTTPPAPAPTVMDPAVTPASDLSSSEVGRAVGPGPHSEREGPQVPPPALSNEGEERETLGTESWRDTTDVKQKARWLLQLAREQIAKRRLDLATNLLEEAQAMPVSWGKFDDTPEKVRATLVGAKAAGRRTSDESVGRVTQGSTPRGARPVSRRTAKSRLREARAALNTGEFEQAEAIAQEVKAWNASLLPFDDTPDKLLAAVDAARRRLNVGADSGPAPAAPGFMSGSAPLTPHDETSEYLKGSRFELPPGPAGTADERAR